ncbi:MAG: DNA alkylation repair protein [Chloroflexota bacterium]
MPAIHLPRLRKQIHELSDQIADPKLFLSRLKDLFDYYGDRTLRPSQLAAKPTAIPSANVPNPVLRHTINGLSPHALSTPHLILDLCRELWNFGWLEHRLLASQLLGKLPLDDPDGITTLVEQWCLDNHEEALLESLSKHSLTQLQTENPNFLIATAAEWIGAPETRAKQKPPIPASALINLQKLGLRGLIPLITEPTYENLPRIYNALRPIMADPPKVLRPDLLDIIRSLARRSSAETAYFLRDLACNSPTATLTWLIRRGLNAFPEDTQTSLRELINPTKPALN